MDNQDVIQDCNKRLEQNNEELKKLTKIFYYMANELGLERLYDGLLFIAGANDLDIPEEITK